MLIDSKTDTLPVGSARDLWNPQALAKLQAKIDHAEGRAREVGGGHAPILFGALVWLMLDLSLPKASACVLLHTIVDL